MGRYITHEQIPFKGKLVKIRMRSYWFSNVVSQSQNEEELLEMTPDGIVKLSATRTGERKKHKVQIPVEVFIFITVLEIKSLWRFSKADAEHVVNGLHHLILHGTKLGIGFAIFVRFS